MRNVSSDHVTSPVLFVIGRNDSRCPYRQAMAYVDKGRAKGKVVVKVK